MNKNLLKLILLIFLVLINNNVKSKENIMILKLKDGDLKIQLFPEIAPKHVERIKFLADKGEYDNVVFHRVIEGFMAQTGDVQFGNSSNDKYDLRRVGTGGSSLPDLKSEFKSFTGFFVFSAGCFFGTFILIVYLHCFCFGKT